MVAVVAVVAGTLNVKLCKLGDAMKIRAINERGFLIGETHPRAKLTDRQVDELRDMYEEEAWSISHLALWFGLSVSTVHSIVTYQTRAQTPRAWRKGKTILR